MQIEKCGDNVDIYIDKYDNESDICACIMFAEMCECTRLIIQSELPIPEGVFEDTHIGDMEVTRLTEYSVVYQKL